MVPPAFILVDVDLEKLSTRGKKVLIDFLAWKRARWGIIWSHRKYVNYHSAAFRPHFYVPNGVAGVKGARAPSIAGKANGRVQLYSTHAHTLLSQCPRDFSEAPSSTPTFRVPLGQRRTASPPRPHPASALAPLGDSFQPKAGA